MNLPKLFANEKNWTIGIGLHLIPFFEIDLY